MCVVLGGNTANTETPSWTICVLDISRIEHYANLPFCDRWIFCELDILRLKVIKNNIYFICLFVTNSF